MKKLNSNDIAKLAGVSRSTVCRVINGYSNVPEETRQKVMKVIKENHYYPLISGRLLSGKTTKTLGLFWIGGNRIAQDALSSSFFMHVIDAAAQREYLVLSCILSNLSDNENVNYVRKIFMEGRIDAGIFVGLGNNEPLIDELVGLDKIVGLFDYYHENEDVPNRVYDVCAEMGLRIPEDISVVGADGDVSGKYTTPPLTTFTFDFKEMFASLVNRVIDAVEQKEDVPQSDFIEGHLLVRDSCRRIEM